MDQIGVNIGICLGNSHDNFQLHKREYSKSFRGGATFLTHTVHQVCGLQYSLVILY